MSGSTPITGLTQEQVERIVALFPSIGMKSPAWFHEWRTHRTYLEDVIVFDSAENAGGAGRAP